MIRPHLVAALALLACGPSTTPGTVDGLPTGDGVPPPEVFHGPFDDFPVEPIIDGTAPPNAADLFGDPTSGSPSGGPCLVEPEVGTLFPNNWLRPRFSWVPTGTENLFELRLSTANEVNALRVYTTATTWTMPSAIWAGLATHIVDAPITVTVRGATFDGTTLTAGPELGSAGDIAIAPAQAPGAIVYWTTSGGTGLRGFRIGDETVRDIVRPADIDASTRCVGCHSSTPDGAFVGISATNVDNNGDPAMLRLLSSDGSKQTPPFISAAAQTLMARQGQEQPVFSRQHWQAGDHTAVTMYQVNNRFEMIWTDLETASADQGVGWGVVPRNGDANMAAYASFGHLDDTLLYVSAPLVSSGVTTTSGDLATVPFANRAGGTSSPIPGANTPMFNEYYPTFSPDDRFIAFNRVPDGQSSYNNGAAEVFAIPRAGGTPFRLRANDPPACSGRTSPGVTNSWPKWAPGASDANGKRYYWLTFSSTRGPGNNPQLYVTPIVDDGTTQTTYPALYLWNQPPAENNHTPAWDNFGIIAR